MEKKNSCSWQQLHFLTKIRGMGSLNLGAFYAENEWKMLEFPIGQKLEVTICSSKFCIRWKAHLLLVATALDLGLPSPESLG